MKRLLLIIGSLIIILNSCKQENKNDVSKKLPSFSFLLSDSITTFHTSAIPNNCPVVLFYFGAYCEHSRRQIEEIIEHLPEFKNTRFYLITTDPFDDMKMFYNDYNLKKYPNIVVGVDNTNFFRTYYKILTFPAIIIYDKNHILKEIFASEIYGRKLRESIYPS